MTCHFCGHPTTTLDLAADGVTLIEECDVCGATLDPVFVSAQGTNHESAYEEAD